MTMTNYDKMENDKWKMPSYRGRFYCFLPTAFRRLTSSHQPSVNRSAWDRAHRSASKTASMLEHG